MADRRVDPCTLSTKAEQAITTKLTLEWDVDFDKKTLSGNAKLDIKVLQDGVAKLVRFMNLNMDWRNPAVKFDNLFFQFHG